MGIQTSAKLMYGCFYSEVPEDIIEQVDEMLDNEELDFACPSYDAPREEWIIGVEVDIDQECFDGAMYRLQTLQSEIPSILKIIDLMFYITAHVV